MKRNRRAAAAAGLVLAAGIGLTACGAPNGSENDIELTLMFWGDDTAPAAWDEITEAFIADGHENVSFEYIHQPSEYETKVQTLIAANQSPDVFLINEANVARFAADGALLDLGAEWEGLGYDIEAEFTESATTQWEDATIALAPNVNAIVMYYDKAAFDEAGVAYPPTDPAEAWTWQEFTDAAGQLTSGEGDSRNWGAFIAPWMTTWTPFVYSNGGSWWNDDATEFNLDSPEAVEVFEAYQDLYAGDYGVPYESLNSIGFDVILQSRRTAMFIDGTWNSKVVADSWGEDTGIALIPVFDEFQSMAITDPLVGGAATEHPELVAEFIHYVAANPEKFPGALGGAPTSLDYLEGDKQDLWFDALERPEGYQETLAATIANSRPHPARSVVSMPEIEFPLVMSEALLPYFEGEIDDVSGALDAIAPQVETILQR